MCVRMTRFYQGSSPRESAAHFHAKPTYLRRKTNSRSFGESFSDVNIGDKSLAEFRTITPFVLAIVALLWFARRRPLVQT